jgi:hypothetical protein
MCTTLYPYRHVHLCRSRQCQARRRFLVYRKLISKAQLTRCCCCAVVRFRQLQGTCTATRLFAPRLLTSTHTAPQKRARLSGGSAAGITGGDRSGTNGNGSGISGGSGGDDGANASNSSVGGNSNNKRSVGDGGIDTRHLHSGSSCSSTAACTGKGGGSGGGDSHVGMVTAQVAGPTVLRVACGRQHSALLVCRCATRHTANPASTSFSTSVNTSDSICSAATVYTMGCGLRGELGGGDCKSASGVSVGSSGGGSGGGGMVESCWSPAEVMCLRGIPGGIVGENTTFRQPPVHDCMCSHTICGHD